MNKVYFKNLNGLRFIAALLVLLRHCQFMVIKNAPSQNLYSNYFNRLGNFGVDLFFTLSGFLITFLLLTELKNTGSIRVKYFYFRRILRIWPLYFGVGILGILLGPLIFHLLGVELNLSFYDYIINLAFLFMFSVNFQFNLNLINPGMIGVLWSVCIEEQFYLIWAPLLKYFKNYIVTIITIAISIGFICIVLFGNQLYYFTLFKFYHFGLGAGLSYLYLKDSSFKQFQVIFKPIVQYFCLAIILLFLFNIIALPLFDSIAYGVIAVYIVGALVQPTPVFNLENKVLKYLGTISYGIYIYHFFCIHICFKIMHFLLSTNTLLFHIVFPLTSICLAIVVASLSYYLFESYFLNKKIKYQVVNSQ